MNRYVLLRDTFGGGLIQWNDELYIYDGEDELKSGILNAVQECREEFYIMDTFDPDEICIALLLENIDDIPCSEYITQIINGDQEKRDKEEYNLYLKLKEKYDG